MKSNPDTVAILRAGSFTVDVFLADDGRLGITVESSEALEKSRDIFVTHGLDVSHDGPGPEIGDKAYATFTTHLTAAFDTAYGPSARTPAFVEEQWKLLEGGARDARISDLAIHSWAAAGRTW